VGDAVLVEVGTAAYEAPSGVPGLEAALSVERHRGITGDDGHGPVEERACPASTTA